MILLLIFFTISILFSFLCSIWEAVLLSITPSYINRATQEGSPLGAKLISFKKDVDRPLAAILTLNTIAHTVGAIGVGAQAGKLFGNHYFNLFGLSISIESVIAGTMTLAILVLSEIIPKTIGANKWKQLVPFTIRSLSILLIVLAPFVWLSQWITRSLKSDKNRSVLSRGDFVAMARAVQQSGVLKEKESTIISNLFELERLTVRDIMTPRAVIFVVDGNTTLNDFYQQNKKLRFSRIPIYENEYDHITGFVLKDEILQDLLAGESDALLKEKQREIAFVEDNKPLLRLFDFFMENKRHIAIVVDEFGSIAGLVTMEDVFETLIGLEIVDEMDKIEDLQQYARDRWEERAEKMGLLDKNSP